MRGRTGTESPSLIMLANALGVDPVWLQTGKGNYAAEPTPRLLQLVENGRQVGEHEEKIFNDLQALITSYRQATDHGRLQMLKIAAAAEQRPDVTGTLLLPRNNS